MHRQFPENGRHADHVPFDTEKSWYTIEYFLPNNLMNETQQAAALDLTAAIQEMEDPLACQLQILQDNHAEAQKKCADALQRKIAETHAAMETQLTAYTNNATETHSALLALYESQEEKAIQEATQQCLASCAEQIKEWASQLTKIDDEVELSDAEEEQEENTLLEAMLEVSFPPSLLLHNSHILESLWQTIHANLPSTHTHLAGIALSLLHTKAATKLSLEDQTAINQEIDLTLKPYKTEDTDHLFAKLNYGGHYCIVAKALGDDVLYNIRNGNVEIHTTSEVGDGLCLNGRGGTCEVYATKVGNKAGFGISDTMKLIIHASTGDEAGAGMSGEAVMEIHESVGNAAGKNMKGGTLIIHGNAKDNLRKNAIEGDCIVWGNVGRQAAKGQSGGRTLIKGTAKDELGIGQMGGYTEAASVAESVPYGYVGRQARGGMICVIGNAGSDIGSAAGVDATIVFGGGTTAPGHGYMIRIGASWLRRRWENANRGITRAARKRGDEWIKQNT